MRSARLIAVGLAAGALLAMPAAAKQGVRAKLDEPVRLDTAPGKTIRVAWHLADEEGRPFGASGIYLRVSRCGRAPLKVPATERALGGYSARVRVPKGGIRKLNVTGLEALAQQLLRQESVASSRIEGLVMSHRRLARAAVADADQHRDMSAEAILASIAAMEHAITTTSTADTITVPALVDVHRVLMENTLDAHFAGVVRSRQNWIGGNNYNPRGAAFVPPPEDEVNRLLGDVAVFMNRSDLSPTLQAAIAHAQFETIHPFADGNGRTGRCLIHVVHRRAALAPRFVPPVSLVLATDSDAYVKGLTAYRAEHPEDWYLDFALTVIKACRAARQLAARIDALAQQWIAKTGDPRRNSTARKLIELLPGQPILRVSHVVALTGASPTAAHNAVNQLEQAGVLKQVTVGKRNRAWEAVGLLRLVDEFERRLATADRGDDKPARPAPFLN